MATTRLIPLHVGEGRSIGTAISDIIEYVENPDKTDGFQLVSSYQCDSRSADMEFLFAKKLYQQKTGRIRGKDDVIAYHLRQSFAPGEITPEEANRLGRELARRFTKGRNPFVVATHIDKHHIHNHIIINSITLDHTRKLRNFWGSSHAIRRLNDTICIENGYSIIEDPKGYGKSYNMWQGDVSRLSHRDQICLAIDQALTQNPKSFDELLSLLCQAGYEIKGSVNPSLKGGTQKRGIRMDTLGPGYSASDLKDVIAGKKQHSPKRIAPAAQASQRKNRLLIDIHAKLAEGKGPGYAKWAQLYNLKQKAQTIIFLQDNGLMDYEVLSQKAALAAEQFHKVSDEIKSAEQRLSEIAVLEKHILNYIKTRDVYVEYRKAGYSKNFREKHESDILLHQSAKQYFDSLGMTKLPSIKSLKTEYAELLAKKKAMYGEYQQRRNEMKELLTAKANVDQILGHDRSSHTREEEKKPSAR